MLKKLFNKFVKRNESEEAITIETPDIHVDDAPVVQTRVEPPKLDFFEFNVAGVTAKNENKKDIQKVLRQQGKRYAEVNSIDLYAGYTNKEIIEDDLEVAEFEDLMFYQDELSFVPEPTNHYDPNAIKVFITYDEEPVHIGFVPKAKTVNLKKILDNEDVRRIEAQYVGGKIKSVAYDSDKDKDVVVTEELNLGVKVKVFY